MSNNYEANAARLDRAEDETRTWCRYIDPEDARRDIRGHLLGQLMAATDPGTFAAMVERAEAFAGRPQDS